MNYELDSIERKVVKALRLVEEKAESIPITDAAWTRAVKNDLARAETSLGYEVYASSCDEATDSEWLFDVTWIKYDENRYMKSVPLVLESEWAHRAVLDDFCKLIVARADHRVLIFWENDQNAADKRIDELVQEVTNSGLTQSGDRYLFACWLEAEDRFLFCLYVAS
jgi:hypothetical protein